MKLTKHLRPNVKPTAALGAALSGLLVLFLLFQGCETMGTMASMGANIAASAGVISHSQADAITKSANAMVKAAEDFTPEQEYYIGRTISAIVLAKYKAYNHKQANHYLNVLGRSLAQASDMPETFGGYHFLIQNSDDINAFAAPGGFIFVTRGMLRLCRSEDAVAAVLAHEIGHVQHKHGLKAISKSRYTAAFSTILAESAKNLGSAELAQLTDSFEDMMADIAQSLINNGYSRTTEREADKAAISIMQRLGYDPNGLVDMLQVMDQKLKPGGLDFAKTHPDPQSRIEDARSIIGPYKPVKLYKTRQARFRAALNRI